jgi:hypothetical protein
MLIALIAILFAATGFAGAWFVFRKRPETPQEIMPVSSGSAPAPPTRDSSPRTILKYLAICAGVSATVFLLSKMAYVATGWWLYTWFFGKLQDAAGLPELVAATIAIWCVAAVLLIGPAVVTSFFFRNRRRAILLSAAMLSAWFVGLFLLTIANDGNFNSWTGKPQAKYARINGQICLFPMWYGNYHKTYGVELRLVTPEIIREYEKGHQTQRSGMRSPTAPPGVFGQVSIRTLWATPRGTDIPAPAYTGFSFYPERGKAVIVKFPNGKECETQWVGSEVRLTLKNDPGTPCGFGNPVGWINVRSKTGEVEVEVVKEPLPRP